MIRCIELGFIDDLHEDENLSFKGFSFEFSDSNLFFDETNT